MSSETLLALAGATPPRPDIARLVLIVIDAQNEYVNGPLALDGARAALKNTAELIGLARKHGRPVIHVVHAGAAGGLFDRAAARGQIVKTVEPVGGETVIEKKLPNSFAGTPLSEHLEGLDFDSLLLCGFMTHMCVSSTARSALDHGYASLVVKDACATRSLPDPAGGNSIPAEVVHNTALAELSDRFAFLTDTRSILNASS